MWYSLASEIMFWLDIGTAVAMISYFTIALLYGVITCPNSYGIRDRVQQAGRKLADIRVAAMEDAMTADTLWTLLWYWLRVSALVGLYLYYGNYYTVGTYCLINALCLGCSTPTTPAVRRTA